jgi:FkbM family methyltransferase
VSPSGDIPQELRGLRRAVHLKLRFGLARLWYCPVRYRLRTPGCPDFAFRWTRVIPFMDPARGAFDFDLYGWDVRELRFLRRFLRPGLAFVDIGAHHGLYSILALRAVGPEGRVAAFEPAPAAFRRLRWHLRLNQAGAVQARACALGERAGTATLHVPRRGLDTISSLRPPGVGQGPTRAVAVELATLDEATKDWPAVDLVKLDAEGAELAILAGSTRTLERHAPIWLFEALDATGRSWGASGRALVDRLLSLGCRLFEFTPEGRLAPHQPREHYPLVSNCNLLAVPRRREAEVAAHLAAPASHA